MRTQRGLALAQLLSHIGPELMSWPLAQRRSDALTWSPDVDAFDRDGTLVVRVDLPGVSASDVHVEIAAEALTISGERRGEAHRDDDNWQVEERAYGRFFRHVALPDGAWPTRAAMTLTDGVLEITVPIVPFAS